MLLFARFDGARYTLVGVNVGDADQTVPFWFPIGGDYVEELHGGVLNLSQIAALQETPLTISSNYGRIWTAIWTTSHEFAELGDGCAFARWARHRTTLERIPVR